MRIQPIFISLGKTLADSNNNYSKSKVTPNQIQNEDYHKWTTHSIQMCGGELGGNVSIGKTFVPLTW